MTPEQRRRLTWRRHYKAVLLLHTCAKGERFVVVGIKLLNQGEGESTALWPMVDNFVKHQPGVMKKLLMGPSLLLGARLHRWSADWTS